MQDEKEILKELKEQEMNLESVEGDENVNKKERVKIEEEEEDVDMMKYIMEIGNRKIEIVIGDKKKSYEELRMEGYRREISEEGIEGN